ncbi:MAG: heavy metal translocating P-type ATPase, partial [Agathobacter rectalis]
HYESANVPQTVIKTSGRELNNSYQEKLIGSVVWHYSKKLLLPLPIRIALTIGRSVKYIGIGLKCLLQRKIEVPVLDATAITVSLITKDFSTASSIMFLLGIGELLEEWTHKKSVDDLARSMSLNVSKVWLRTPENQEILVESSKIEKGDKVVVHMGNVIPFDGEVLDGDAMVNQASLTGESVPVQRTVGNTVFAGTVVEEGEITIRVKEVEGNNRFDQIVTMIEESEKLKSELEGKAEHYADKLVPWTLGATGLTYLLTRNVTKAMSILMVDFCCALKLAMPISVLSAIREASLYNVTVKGGKFLEAVAEADTIVFDKTGTLTKAHPTVVDVVNFNDEYSSDDMLRVAACLEEHFPHSMAKAVVDAASKKGLSHEEMHTKVEYIVAHGIATSINGKRTVIGSYHFVFEDEKCVVPAGKEQLFESLPLYYSHLYLAVEGMLSAVICIEDPLRDEAAAVVTSLKKAGISKVVMMTGDSERTASVIAKKVGVDEYYAEVLPEDKAAFVEREKAKGRKVIMIGDGINDSPALSAANVGIAISDGAEIAREIADITVGSDDLYQIVTLKYISNALMKRIKSNYRKIVGFNSGLIALGVAGVLPPTTTALLHNGSTILISVNSMKNLLE